jgi:translation initiation factor IF-1
MKRPIRIETEEGFRIIGEVSISGKAETLIRTGDVVIAFPCTGDGVLLIQTKELKKEAQKLLK